MLQGPFMFAFVYKYFFYNNKNIEGKIHILYIIYFQVKLERITLDLNQSHKSNQKVLLYLQEKNNWSFVSISSLKNINTSKSS